MNPRSPRGLRSVALHISLIAAALVSAAATAPGTAVASRTAHASVAVKARHLDRRAVRAARDLSACQRKVDQSPRHCVRPRHRLQVFGRRLSRLQHRSPRARSLARTAAISKVTAPTLTVSGWTLGWNRIPHVRTYIVVRKAPGVADLYTAVTGTSVTPPAIHGATVSYSVRTAVVGSSWAHEVKISYPSADADTTAAPTLAVSGQTLSWTSTPGASGYVMVTKRPNVADSYEQVSGTSVTPPAHPGETVRYSVRNDVDGGRWAGEVSITYPHSSSTTSTTSSTTTTTAPTTTDSTISTSSTPTTTTTTDSTSSTSSAPAFRAGIVAGSAINWELPFIKTLGARTARMEFDISTPASTIEPYVDAYARAGIQPLLLAGFAGRTPTASEARNLASWAAAFGPNGTFRAGKGYPADTAVTSIEFGNESNQSYQYPTLASDPSWASTDYYATVAKQYALRFQDAAAAIKGANSGVGLLAIADTPGNWSSWMNNVYAAVPNFDELVGGWVVHPYGRQSRWQADIDNALAQVSSHGAPDTIPIYATEYGIATDDGRCLTDNYGWDRCMTYDQAGSALTSTISAMRSRYGSRLRAVYLYQAHDLKSAGATTSRESYFGALKLDGTAKGAFTSAVQSLLAG